MVIPNWIDAATGNLKIEDLPAGVLCRVRAIFSYVKEDVDELSFEVGDIIQMIDYDDPKDKVKCFFALYNLQEYKIIPLNCIEL